MMKLLSYTSIMVVGNVCGPHHTLRTESNQYFSQFPETELSTLTRRIDPLQAALTRVGVVELRKGTTTPCPATPIGSVQLPSSVTILYPSWSRYKSPWGCSVRLRGLIVPLPPGTWLTLRSLVVASPVTCMMPLRDLKIISDCITPPRRLARPSGAAAVSGVLSPNDSAWLALVTLRA